MVKWCHFLEIFPKMCRCQCVWKFDFLYKDYRKGWLTKKCRPAPSPSPFLLRAYFRLVYWCPRSFLILYKNFNKSVHVKMETVVCIILWVSFNVTRWYPTMHINGLCIFCTVINIFVYTCILYPIFFLIVFLLFFLNWNHI